MVYIVDNSINFGDERKSNDTNPLQRNRGAENGAGNDIANMVPEPRGRGAKALRFRRVRPIPRRAVEAFPQPMRHRNMRSKVVPRSHGLSSLHTVKARVLNLLRAKREQSRRERRDGSPQGSPLQLNGKTLTYACLNSSPLPLLQSDGEDI